MLGDWTIPAANPSATGIHGILWLAMMRWAWQSGFGSTLVSQIPNRR